MGLGGRVDSEQLVVGSEEKSVEENRREQVRFGSGGIFEQREE